MPTIYGLLHFNRPRPLHFKSFSFSSLQKYFAIRQ